MAPVELTIEQVVASVLCPACGESHGREVAYRGYATLQLKLVAFARSTGRRNDRGLMSLLSLKCTVWHSVER